jgi:hypothetical protein
LDHPISSRVRSQAVGQNCESKAEGREIGRKYPKKSGTLEM